MGKPNPRRANGARRNAIRARLKASGRPCAYCGMPIDYQAPYWIDTGRVDDEGKPVKTVNPDAFVVDEIVPVARGGDPLDMANCQPMHARCNALKGAHMPSDGDKGPLPIVRSLEL